MSCPHCAAQSHTYHASCEGCQRRMLSGMHPLHKAQAMRSEPVVKAAKKAGKVTPELATRMREVFGDSWKKFLTVVKGD